MSTLLLSTSSLKYGSVPSRAEMTQTWQLLADPTQYPSSVSAAGVEFELVEQFGLVVADGVAEFVVADVG